MTFPLMAAVAAYVKWRDRPKFCVRCGLPVQEGSWRYCSDEHWMDAMDETPL